MQRLWRCWLHRHECCMPASYRHDCCMPALPARLLRRRACSGGGAGPHWPQDKFLHIQPRCCQWGRQSPHKHSCSQVGVQAIEQYKVPVLSRSLPAHTFIYAGMPAYSTLACTNTHPYAHAMLNSLPMSSLHQLATNWWPLGILPGGESYIGFVWSLMARTTTIASWISNSHIGHGIRGRKPLCRGMAPKEKRQVCSKKKCYTFSHACMQSNGQRVI